MEQRITVPRPWWRRAVDLLAAAAFLMTVGVFLWMLIDVHWHMLPVVHEAGTYGNIELPRILTPRTEVVRFDVVRVPSRIVRVGNLFVWPLPEEIYVQLVYRDPVGIQHTWEHTYIVGCEDKGACQPLRVLNGVMLFGDDGQGKLKLDGWVYFRPDAPANAPQYAAPASPTPSPNPPAPPSRRLPPHMLIV